MSEEKQIIIVCPKCGTEYRVSSKIAQKKVVCKRCKETFTAGRRNSFQNRPSHLGELAVKYNLITVQQLAEVLSEVKAGSGVSLESMFLEKKLLTLPQIETLKLTDRFWKTNYTSRRLGAMAVEKGMITEKDFHAALEKQAGLFKEAKKIRHVQDILFKDGILSEADKNTLVAAMNESDMGPAKEKESETAAAEEATTTDEINRFYALVISEDKMSASLRLKTEQAPSIYPDTVRTFLKSNGILHGIIEDDELIARLSSPPDPGTPVLVAKGAPPEPGMDAKIKYHFTTDKKVGTMGAQGHIDFKDKGDVPFVRQGDLLLEKIPAIPGQPGIDVRGDVLTPATPVDVKLLFGSGVELSEDKLKVYAKTDGQPKLTLGGRLSVVSDLVINGDVDLKTGHIDFEGDIKITGTIQSGFNVKGANISAKEIMSAKVVASGNITTTGGIIGATIKAQGDVKAKYIKDTTLSTFGDVIVQKEVIDSYINTSGSCSLVRGKILSSEISAKQGIEVADIGSDLSSPCRLTVGVDDHIEAELEGLENAMGRRRERLEKMQEGMEALEEQQQWIHKKIADLAQIQDRSLVEQRSLKKELDDLPPDDKEKRQQLEGEIAALGTRAHEAENTLGELFDQQDSVTQKVEEIQAQSEQVQDDILELEHESEAIRHWATSQKKAATIKVGGSAAQGTVIAGPHTRSVLKDTCRHITIREVKNTDPDSAVEYEIKIHSK